jgi:hypothetical protein
MTQPDAPVHERGCECLEFGCRSRHRSHGCYCDLPDAAPLSLADALKASLADARASRGAADGQTT